MTKTELRELDAWIGVNVFGKKAIHRDGPKPTEGIEDDYFVIEFVDISCSLPKYTSGEQFPYLLSKCGEKLGADCQSLRISFCESAELLGGKWQVVSIFNECRESDGHISACAGTLELAVCFFAQKLFANPETKVA